MRDPEKFDAFYKDARERLLAQTYALTGDLSASRRAVRDAFVVAWHHWRKLSLLDDPESVVRPQAWKLAQRRHTARVWHRDATIAPEVRATLDALGTLGSTQRRAVILTQLAAVSMPEMAREVGVPLEVAQSELQHGSTQLSLQLEVPAGHLRPLFDEVAASVSDTVTWPRATIVRRAGAARRRTHTAVGVAAVAATLVVSGVVVTSTTGVRPSLDRPEQALSATGSSGDEESEAAGVTEPPPPTLSEATMLGTADVGARYDRDWSTTSTSANDEGAGLVMPCQLERYADPRGEAAMVRTFEARTTQKLPALEVTQLTEASSSAKRARKAFDTTASWFGDCTVERTQLMSTGTPRGVGDEAVQVVLKTSSRPQHTYVVSLARTGVYTTTTVTTSALDDVPGDPGRRASARLLAAGVDKLCTLPDAGDCAESGAVVEARAPLEAGPEPAMLSEIDLPPLPGITEPWVGTEPRLPATNDAASSCDSTTFRGSFRDVAFSNNATRTFVIPGADLPTEFGLTQTMGSLPGAAAQGLVEQVRDALSGCDALNTDVTEIARDDTRDTSLTAWRLEVEVTDERTVTFLMAILREGTSVSQIGFLPTSPDQLAPADFVALCERALERLRELPAPRRS